MSGGAGTSGSCSKPVPSGALLWKRRGQGTATVGHHTEAGPVCPLAGVFWTGTTLGLNGTMPPPRVTVRPTHTWSVVGHVLTLSAPPALSLGRMASWLLLGGPSPPRRAAGSLNHLHPPAEQGGLSVPQDAPQGLRSHLPGDGTKWARWNPGRSAQPSLCSPCTHLPHVYLLSARKK